jgi:integrase
MRLPNGYGSIFQMKDRPRRNPWRVRITTGWNENGKQQFKILGNYPTRTEAMKALVDYHENPYSIEQTITFAELYQKWSAEKFDTISHSNALAYKASYATCSLLYDMQFVQIRKSHLQAVIDNCDKNYPTLRKIKVLFNQLYKFAMENDICEKDYSQFVDIAKHKERTEEKHKPFTDAETNKLWQEINRNEYISVVLMLLYSGVRISELLDLKKENVHLAEQYFDVIESKTAAGIRKVPIADRTLLFFKHWMQNESDYLICNVESNKMIYHTFIRTYWKPLMKELNLDHIPHDTRHTTISLLARAEVNQTIIKRIVGHAGAMDLTEKVYTHFDIQQLIDAINKI